MFIVKHDFRSVPFSDLVGVSVGPGIWCGTSALVSFFFGLFLDPVKREVSNLPLAVAGLCLLMVAIAGIAFAGEYACRVEDSQEPLLPGNRRRGRVCDTWGGYAGEISRRLLEHCMFENAADQ